MCVVGGGCVHVDVWMWCVYAGVDVYGCECVCVHAYVYKGWYIVTPISAILELQPGHNTVTGSQRILLCGHKILR